MAVGFAQTAHAEKAGDQSALGGAKSQGTLKTESKDYTFMVLADSASVTEAVNQFLQEINQQQALPETIQEHLFTFITPHLMETETDIARLLAELAKPQKETASQENRTKGELPLTKPMLDKPTDAKRDAGKSQSRPEGEPKAPSRAPSEVVYTSLFTLARAFHSNQAAKKEPTKQEAQNRERPTNREEGRAPLLSPSQLLFERPSQQNQRMDREGNGKQDKEGKEGGQQQQKRQDQRGVDKRKKLEGIGTIQAARMENQPSGATGRAVKGVQAASNSPPPTAKNSKALGGVENIYIRFMALMARILGQAEAEAHDLYMRIKERTDNIDTLTLLLSKINSEKGAIDWTNNEEMKKLIEKARSLGVEIPADKLTWSEDEKKLFKENIQMRKDSMEKITQLERTDMQRYLQEASQCHQARSNVLKLLKEVIDTILANLRP